MKIYIFEDLLVFECLILEIYSKYNLVFNQIKPKQFTKWCFALWFYNAIKTMGKRKKDDTYLRKKPEEKQNSVTIMIYVVGNGTVFPVKFKLKGESF